MEPIIRLPAKLGPPRPPPLLLCPGDPFPALLSASHKSPAPVPPPPGTSQGSRSASVTSPFGKDGGPAVRVSDLGTPGPLSAVEHWGTRVCVTVSQRGPGGLSWQLELRPACRALGSPLLSSLPLGFLLPSAAASDGR